MSEGYKNEDDKVTPGCELGHIDDNMAGSYLLFRGAQMKFEWVQPYIQAIGGKEIKLSGNNSCSKSLKVALEFALDKEKDQHSPTIFVIPCQNF